MAMTTRASRNGRGEGSRSIVSEKSVLDDANRILDMVLMDSEPVHPSHTGHRQRRQRATGAGQRSKRTRTRSSSSPEPSEALKKTKTALADDGSRNRDDDDDDDDEDVVDNFRDPTKSNRDRGGAVERTAGRGDGPRPTTCRPICVGRGKAPLAQPENSTVTPEPEQDVERKMRFFHCRSVDYNEADDEVENGLSSADEEFDDVDGDLPTDETDEKDRILAEIAIKLRNIGDAENNRVSQGLGSMSKSASATLIVSMIAIEGVQDLVKNLTYDQFQDVVNRNLGSEPGVQQVTVMFSLARAAVRHLGIGTKAAGDVKRYAFEYFRNNVVRWVSQNGGWEGIAQSL